MISQRENCRGAEALVQEGEEAFAEMRESIEKHGPLPCWVGALRDFWGGAVRDNGVPRCERSAVMSVYGMPMCSEHGEEAKQGALEELYYDASQEIQRPLNPHVPPLNPTLERALRHASSVLLAEVHEAEADEEALLRAFPLNRERAAGDTLGYVADPHSPEWREYLPPYDSYQRTRLLIHKLMRLAYEDGQQYLVELLEQPRESTAAQAAYALALEREAGVRS